MNHGYRKIRQGSVWSSTATATTKKKKRFAKPGCGFRAINYRDRLGRFARQKVSGYLGYIEEKREGGSRYIPDVLKVLWDLVELDKFVGPSPRGQHRLGLYRWSRKPNLRSRRVLAQSYRIFGISSPWILGKAVMIRRDREFHFDRGWSLDFPSSTTKSRTRARGAVD